MNKLFKKIDQFICGMFGHSPVISEWGPEHEKYCAQCYKKLKS